MKTAVDLLKADQDTSVLEKVAQALGKFEKSMENVLHAPFLFTALQCLSLDDYNRSRRRRRMKRQYEYEVAPPTSGRFPVFCQLGLAVLLIARILSTVHKPRSERRELVLVL